MLTSKIHSDSGSFAKVKRAFPVLFYLALIIFLIRYLNTINLSILSEAELNWGLIFIASLIGLAARFWQVLIWFTLLQSLGAKDLGKNKAALNYAYAKSWLGRYIPGTAPWILGKIYFASKHNVPKSKLAVSSLLEAILHITVVMAAASLMLSLDNRLGEIEAGMKILTAGTLILCTTIVTPPIFNRIASLAFKLVRRKKLASEHHITGKTIARGALLYAVSSLLSGLSLYFIAKAVYPTLESHDLLFVMGASNLAAAASMLAIFAPSGIGVREGIQVILLSIIIPTEYALLIALATRLWSIAVDFIFFGLSKALTTKVGANFHSDTTSRHRNKGKQTSEQ